MVSKEFFGFLAVAFCLINLGLYSITILKGKTKPHAFSWLLWAVVMGTVCVAQFLNNAGAGSWQTGVSALMCLAIGILALFYGERKGTLTDWIAIGLAVSAIPIWLITKNAMLSVVLLTIIDGLGFYPTFRKGYVLPHEENVWRPFRATLSFAAAFLAIEHYSFTTALYPASMILIEFCLGVMLVARRRINSHQ